MTYRGRCGLVLALVGALIIAACGSDEPSADPTTTVATTIAPTSTTGADTSTSTADASATSEPSATTTTAVESTSTAVAVSTTVAATVAPTTTATTAAPAPPPTGPTVADIPAELEDLGLRAQCDDGTLCTSVQLDETGTLVSYDRSTGVITFHGATPRTVMLVPSVAENVLSLVAVGPDGVAYFIAQQPETTDPVGYVAAVGTTGANAGQSITSVDGLDRTGDSDLYPTPAGLVLVGCCGGVQRPDAAAMPFIGWVDHSGASLVSARPALRIDYASDSAVVTRRNDGDMVLSWTISGSGATRSMPVLAALSDGGVIIDLTDPFVSSSTSRVLRLRPDGTISEAAIAPATLVLAEPTGALIVLYDGGYFRLRPFAS